MTDIHRLTIRHRGSPTQEMTNEVQNYENTFQQELVRADRDSAEIERTMEELRIAHGYPQNEEEEADSKQLLEELQAQKKINEDLQTMCKTAMSSLGATIQHIEGVTTEESSNSLAGIIGASSGLREQKISNISAKKESFAFAGTHSKDLDLSNFAAPRRDKKDSSKGN